MYGISGDDIRGTMEQLTLGLFYLITDGVTYHLVEPYRFENDIWYCNIMMSTYDFGTGNPKFYYYKGSMFSVTPIKKYWVRDTSTA